METPRERINCTFCKHYYVTWDQRAPRGCRFYGIKTRDFPSAAIIRTSGRPCLAYERKKPPAAGKKNNLEGESNSSS